jgi:hypothetical protein
MRRRWDFSKIEHTKNCDQLQWQGLDGPLWWSEIKSPTKQYCFIQCVWGPLLGLDWERKSEEEGRKMHLHSQKDTYFFHIHWTYFPQQNSNATQIYLYSNCLSIP